MSIENCKLIEIPKISDPRGNLTFVEQNNHVPFEIKRIFYVYDIPTAESRGAHAHKENEQFMICLSGSLDVCLDDGFEKKTIHLNRPWQGLYIPPMIWASENNFDPGTLYIVLASELYDADDYHRDYEKYLQEARG
jgi:dTDP-4-dehydrorhamnose 3,5-epimerase-like enzyme